MRRSNLWGALAVAALLLLYVAFVAQRAVLLIASGRPAGIAIGAAALVIPVLTLWFLAREFAMVRAIDRLTATMRAEDSLDVDDLPRSPGGRIDREVAGEQFEGYRAVVEAEPRSWRAWYRLGWAYDAAGDRRRAREALRQAVSLERAQRTGR